LLLLRRIEDLIRELEVAISAAREAGEMLREGFGAEQAVRYKGEVDIVTEADECAEGVIRESLFGVFPSYWMLAEEGELAGEKDTRWIVDSLNGRV
jgi:fructose-1,6-bisphosphatase/inositol monophosphatase family enzyme